MTEELMPCPFCNVKPKRRLSKVTYCQLHGEPSQQDIIYCDNIKCPVNPSMDYGLASNKNNWLKAVSAWNTRAQPREQVTPLASQSSVATSKYKRVDLDLMKEPPTAVRIAEYTQGYGDGFNKAIDDIKSKYGDLYVEVK